ncbi:hypothetical protein DB35_22910 [Streptomyces abyssalis]|uniref:hypothetical protein n=1 Tax=Streptomyces abyssalis TaxID=933944 RepID=UPI00085C262A|nr:hypothetical protein [Streptomyces abyssalis]OEU86568.1 hypothetical protein DB35_22910 [Streptomyces abyssalis]
MFWVFRRKARKKREARETYAELQSFAESRGWRYENGVPGLVDAYQGASPLPITASGLGGDHVVTGSHRGFGFRAFEYRHYSTDLDVDGADTSSVTIHSFWALNLGVEVPDLRIYRDGWFDTVSRGRAMEVGIPQLDKDFHIVSKDEERARAVLFGGLAEFLTSDRRASELELRLHNGQLITWRTRTGLSSATFDGPLDYLADAAGHLGIGTPAQPPRL